MRVLDVSPRLVEPPDNGFSSRIYHLMCALARHHEVRQFSQPRLRQLRAGIARLEAALVELRGRRVRSPARHAAAAVASAP